MLRRTCFRRKWKHLHFRLRNGASRGLRLSCEVFHYVVWLYLTLHWACRKARFVHLLCLHRRTNRIAPISSPVGFGSPPHATACKYLKAHSSEHPWMTAAFGALFASAVSLKMRTPLTRTFSFNVTPWPRQPRRNLGKAAQAIPGFIRCCSSVITLFLAFGL